MSDFKIIFIHGYTASHLADWYPKLSPELEKLGIDFAVPDLPGGKHPYAKEWLDVIDKEAKNTNKPLVLVGHSLGTRTALLYLDKFRPKVEKVFLIAAFSNSTENAKRRGGNAYPDFFKYIIKLEEIKPLVGKFIVLHSQDDSSIDYAQGVEIARDLDAKLITFNDRGHFFNPNDAPFVLEVLRKELNF
ncbi:MAG TPA: alpha/beta fold hydrolase [Xanthomonadales bacterium]|nr:alpha/beta fold hydrolase [Xanthomonadales bacterium]